MKRFLMVVGLIALPTITQADVCHTFGLTLPSTCVTGECFHKTGIPRGFYDCTSTNVWTVWGLLPIDNSVQIANGLQWESKLIPDCTGTGKALQYIAGSNTFACVTGLAGPTIVRKAADQASTVVVFADVTGMTFAVAASATYSFNCELSYLSQANTTALQVSMNGPLLPTALRYTVSTATSATASHYASQSAYDTVTNPASGLTTALPIRLTGTLTNGINSGTLALRMRSEVSLSSVTIQRGSWCALW